MVSLNKLSYLCSTQTPPRETRSGLDHFTAQGLHRCSNNVGAAPRPPGVETETHVLTAAVPAGVTGRTRLCRPTAPGVAVTRPGHGCGQRAIPLCLLGRDSVPLPASTQGLFSSDSQMMWASHLPEKVLHALRC